MVLRARVLRMDVVYSYVCELDVHKKNIVACDLLMLMEKKLQSLGVSVTVNSVSH